MTSYGESDRRELRAALRELHALIPEKDRLEAENRAMRALLGDLRRARPLMLYGQPWIADIENVLAGHDYTSAFPTDEKTDD